MQNPRKYGDPPHRVAVVHGGPGAGGELAPVARMLAKSVGVLEPIQTATSLDGQVEELKTLLEEHAELPATLVGFSWGAWLALIAAARHPHLARKLVLVGCGPFEERYTERLRAARLERLAPPERAEFDRLTEALSNPDTGPREKDTFLERLGALVHKSDTYEAIATEREVIPPSGEIFQNVWNAAAQMRRSGELLELARLVRCPVIAIHGDHDPHPADGVREPLASILREFRFVELERCGHSPWIERHACDAFYATLLEEHA
jgi:pimeloyl-ACP methyl ester carboxylesterase